jgi:hypothetical protein
MRRIHFGRGYGPAVRDYGMNNVSHKRHDFRRKVTGQKNCVVTLWSIQRDTLIRVQRGKFLPLQAWACPWGSGRLRLPDFLDFRHYEGGRVVTPTHRPSLLPGIFLVLIFRGWLNPVAHGSVGSFGKQSPATPLRIDTETLRLVGQCLNHYATPGPTSSRKVSVIVVIFWLILIKLEFSRQVLEKTLKCQISWKSVHWKQSCSRRADG